ncbi:MAG: hypothetical protein ACKO4T_10450 [Planctomycetaceae bacterium]
MAGRAAVVAAAWIACLAVVGAGRRGAAEVVLICGTPAGRAAGPPRQDRVNEPFAVDFDAAGSLWGVEYLRGNRVFRIAAPLGGTPEITFVAGGFHVATEKDRPRRDDETDAATVRFQGLHDIAVARDGHVFVADTFGQRIRGVHPGAGRVEVVAGTGEPGFAGDGGPAVAAVFHQPYCCGLEPGGGGLLVADIRNARLRRVDLRAGLVATIAGDGRRGRPVDGAAATATPLTGPRAACMAADGTIYLALREGNAVLEIRAGRLRTVVNASGDAGHAGDGGPARDALLAGPKYVAVDGRGRVLIADTENHCIRRYDPQRETIVTVAGVPRQAGAAVGADLATTQLSRPHGCRIAPDGRLVIADSDNDRVLAGWISLERD